MAEFVDPFSGLVPRKLTTTELARAIMLDISAELEAIHLYQAHIDATDDERAKTVLAHVRDEEIEHTGEFLALLEHLDPALAGRVREGRAEVMELIRRVEAGMPAGRQVEAAPQTAPPPSVGDLRRETVG
ncbi:MAG: ubiquinone biosynthesis protein COQ7 [Pseudomonadota bacterium]